MKPYKLTEKEIIKHATKDSEYCGLSIDVGKWSAYAAQKKLLEYIKENSERIAPIRDDRIPDDGYWHVTAGRAMYEDVWEALLKAFDL